jgi:hypothetical protein
MMKYMPWALFVLLCKTSCATSDSAFKEFLLDENSGVMNQVSSTLRGAGAPKNDRDLVFLCNAIEGIFGQEEIDCKCNNRWLFGELAFKCTYLKYKCATENVGLQGEICTIPSIEGKFNWFLFQLKYEAFGRICNTNSWANNTLGGDFFMGDLCFDITAQTGLTVPTGVTQCGADFFGVSCDSCKRCTYDIPATNRTGVSLKCSNLAVAPCFPFEVPAFVSDAKEAKKQIQPVEFIRGYVESGLLMSNLLIDQASILVEEATRRI